MATEMRYIASSATLTELQRINELLCDGFAGKAAVAVGELLDELENSKSAIGRCAECATLLIEPT
jgi:hypothetical protein